MTAATPCPRCCTRIGERFGPVDCPECGGSGTASTPGTPATTCVHIGLPSEDEMRYAEVIAQNGPPLVRLSALAPAWPHGVWAHRLGRAVAEAVAAREEGRAEVRESGETADAVCDCYPGGVSPETYEGPQEWCEVHGQTRMVLIQHRDAARDLVDKLRAELEAAQQILATALDGEEVSRGDLAYDVDTVVEQRDEARHEATRLAQARRAALAEAQLLRDLAREQYPPAVTDGFAAAERHGAELALSSFARWVRLRIMSELSHLATRAYEQVAAEAEARAAAAGSDITEGDPS